MTKLRKIFILLLVLVLGVMSLTGCQDNAKEAMSAMKEGKTASAKVGAAVAAVKPDPEIQVAANINLLTGMPDLSKEAIGKRPVAVMVNNVTDSFPQYGIEAADVIFEIPVEGQLTRFMALYADYTQMPVICSIRSCRPYFPAFSEGFDAVYVNWGMNDEVRAYVNSLKLTHYEGLYNAGGLFSRDTERKAAGYALEHTSVFDGTRLDEVMHEKGQRTDIEADKRDTAFKFAPINEKVTPTGNTCTQVKVNFGKALATLTYDETTHKYWKSHNGEAQIDGKTGNQLSFTNVLVLEAKIKSAANGVHRDVDWHGGSGYYISNGTMQKIKWSKAGVSDRLMLYDENGKELVLNRGKSYIAVNYIGKATFE